ncbi:MAG: type II toxin-antitoxin system HicA family toxin [Nanoarchaeota archaeon]
MLEILTKFGYKFLRHGRHDVYYNEAQKKVVPVPASHGIITRGVIQSLIKQTGIPREEFFD